MLSTRTTRPLKLLGLAVALAGLGVPTAQAKFDPWTHNPVHKSMQSVPLITEHSAGQNGTDQPSTAQPVRLITEHSAGQNDTGVLSSAAASVSASASTGFQWRDAGVGAGVAFAAVLLTVGVATLIMRRGRGRLAGF
jgi:hypothetical protein